MCAGFRLVNLLLSLFAVRKRISYVTFLFQAQGRSCVHQSCFTVNWLLFWRKEVFLISTVARSGHFQSFVKYLPILWMKLQRICWQSKLYMCKWFNPFFNFCIKTSYKSDLFLHCICTRLQECWKLLFVLHCAHTLLLLYCRTVTMQLIVYYLLQTDHSNASDVEMYMVSLHDLNLYHISGKFLGLLGNSGVTVSMQAAGGRRLGHTHIQLPSCL